MMNLNLKNSFVQKFNQKFATANFSCRDKGTIFATEHIFPVKFFYFGIPNKKKTNLSLNF